MGLSLISNYEYKKRWKGNKENVRKKGEKDIIRKRQETNEVKYSRVY
jgi:hypothetical protein